MENNNWWEELRPYDIDPFKTNGIAHGLLTGWRKSVFESIPMGDIMRWNGREWVHMDPSFHYCKEYTYRLRPDWEPPKYVNYNTGVGAFEPMRYIRDFTEKQNTLLGHPANVVSVKDDGETKKEEEKKEERLTSIAEWHYYEVFKVGTFYYFTIDNTNFNLQEIFGIVGFGGFEFKEIPGRWFMNLVYKKNEDYLLRCDGESKDRAMPATPSRVRFWVEG
jgi:hypothetical protein